LDDPRSDPFTFLREIDPRPVPRWRARRGAGRRRRCLGSRALTEPELIRKILAHVREPPARAPPSGASEPGEPGEDGILAAGVWLDPEVDVSA
jgi:hypothetical protein